MSTEPKPPEWQSIEDLLRRDFVAEPEDLTAALDAGECSAVCLLATAESDCDCRCGGRYHAEGRWLITKVRERILAVERRVVVLESEGMRNV